MSSEFLKTFCQIFFLNFQQWLSSLFSYAMRCLPKVIPILNSFRTELQEIQNDVLYGTYFLSEKGNDTTHFQSYSYHVINTMKIAYHAREEL